MIFRTGAPPIFNFRFTKDKKKTTKISPTGISCVRVNGVYEWQFYGGKVNNMAFAIQITECGCRRPYYGSDAPDSNIPNVYGTCDIYKATCFPKQIPTMALGNIAAVGVPQTASMVYPDLTCVNKVWYYNNQKIESYLGSVISFNCARTEVSWATVWTEPYKHRYVCKCRGFEKIPVETSAASLLRFVSGASYGKTKFRDGIISYDDSTCSAKMMCTGTDTLMIFSGSYKPMEYAPGASPVISCHPSTAHPAPTAAYDTKAQWYVDGIMLNMPVFSCKQTNGCACKYVPLTSANIQKLVGSYSFYPYIGTRTIRTPTDNRPASLICPTEITCTANFTLVVFDFANSSVFPKGKISVKCTTNTRKWAVDKAVDVPTIDVIYAVCVDFR
ncbi:unnamed protein product [Caenorhabditis nigoni]